jgi:hypothetical protein
MPRHRFRYPAMVAAVDPDVILPMEPDAWRDQRP